MESARNKIDGNVETQCEVTPSAKCLNDFLKGLPYGADTAFGYTTLIDPRYFK